MTCAASWPTSRSSPGCSDYLASHKPDAAGKVKITTDPPDAYPVLKFADNTELRHKLWLADHSVGFPANTEILRSLLQAREDLAHLLGYATWADYAMADQMMGSPAKLAEFLKKVDDASREPGAREDAALLKFVQEKDPSIKEHLAAMRVTGRSSTAARASTSTRRACGPTSPTPPSSAA